MDPLAPFLKLRTGRQARLYAGLCHPQMSSKILTSRICVLNQVAIKKMKKKFYSWEECVQLREVKVRTPSTSLCGGQASEFPKKNLE